MRCLPYLICYLIISATAFGQHGFNVKGLPAGITNNADAIVWKDSLHININTAGEADIIEYKEITILNEKGSGNAILSYGCDNFAAADIRDVVLYDANGHKVRSLKKGDVKEVLDGDAAFIHDMRYKIVNFKYANYPFTIVYTVRAKLKSLFFLPKWQPQSSYRLSIINASATYCMPAQMAVKYKALNTKALVSLDATGEVKKISMVLANLPARLEDELQAPVLYESPVLVVVPQNIRLGSYEGNFATWKQMGLFYHNLNAGRNKLPDNVRQLVHSIADTCNDRKRKIGLLYKYLQEHTRYVSIQLGIGGWQTFDAASVAANGYGDCKALSNYMTAMLNEAGVIAYPVLVYAGKESKYSIDNELVDDVFNHVIVCAPGDKDTIWLECTADDIPAGYLSDFTEDRDALLITPAGGVILHTPVYGLAENTQRSKTELYADDGGYIKGYTNVCYSGICRDNEHQALYGKNDDEVKRYLNRKANLLNYELEEYQHKDGVLGEIPLLTEQLSYKGQIAVSVSGNKRFLSSFLNRLPCLLPVSYEARTAPFYIPNSISVADTTLIHLEGSFASEYLPEKIAFSYPFGKYECIYEMADSNTVRVLRIYSQQCGTYNATHYHEYLNFRTRVLATTSSKVVLVKKPG